MDYGLIDTTYRSRITLLNMLESRGYNTAPYRNFSPKEIEQMIGPNALGEALRMDLQRTGGEGQEKCVVIYKFQKQKQKIQTLLNELLDEELPESLRVDPKTMEVIVILNEPVIEQFHNTALSQWKKNNLRIRFFENRRIINDPSSFAIVPKHDKLTEDEVKMLMKELYLEGEDGKRETKKLPIIRFHEDMQARWLGLMPGDIVRITRPSPSAGECVGYRVCAP